MEFKTACPLEQSSAPAHVSATYVLRSTQTHAIIPLYGFISFWRQRPQQKIEKKKKSSFLGGASYCHHPHLPPFLFCCGLPLSTRSAAFIFSSLFFFSFSPSPVCRLSSVSLVFTTFLFHLLSSPVSVMLRYDGGQNIRVTKKHLTSLAENTSAEITTSDLPFRVGHETKPPLRFRQERHTYLLYGNLPSVATSDHFGRGTPLVTSIQRAPHVQHAALGVM